MEDQLNRAYDLIKNGQTDEALPMLEAIIRDDRDNDDAWWLYANAVDDPEAKRNALNNILRIGTNAAREEKVRFMLAQVDDPFALLDDVKEKVEAEKKGLSTGWKIGIGVIAVLGLCTCAFLSLGFSIASRIAYVPDAYDNQGSIIEGELVSGAVDTEGDQDGYTFTAEAGDQLVVSVRPISANIPPFAILYGPDDMLINITNESDGTVNRLRETLPRDGEYTIIVRTLVGLGAGDYSMSVTLNP